MSFSFFLFSTVTIFTIEQRSKDLKTIRETIHNIINQINWDEGYYRKDIGWRYIDE